MEEKGVTKEKVKRLFSWGGWKKEVVWIIIILLLIYCYWGYKRDMKICHEILNNPCEYCYAKDMYERQFHSVFENFNLQTMVYFTILTYTCINSEFKWEKNAT